MARDRHAASACTGLGRLRIQVDGVELQSLAGQTLQNIWQPTQHAEAERLGLLQASGVRLLPNVLERLTWALLCWPKLSELWLQDEQAGSVVARLRRSAGAEDVALHATRGVYVWRDVWVDGESGQLDIAGTLTGAAAFPPAKEQSSARLSGIARFLQLTDVLVPNESAVASRERLKVLIQRYAGKDVALIVQRGYQWLGERIRRAWRAVPCPAEAMTGQLSALTAGSRTAEAVLIMVPRLAPGGAEQNIIELAQRFVLAGIRVHMLTTFGSANSWADRVRVAGIELLQLPDFLPTCCWFEYLVAFVRSRDVRLLHVMNSHWTYEQLPLIKATFPHLRVVTQVHAEGEPGTPGYPALAARFDRWVDGHTVISVHLANYMVDELHVDRDKIRVIRTGIDPVAAAKKAPAQRNVWRVRNGIAADVPIVIFVGRLSELKRPLLFLDIAELVVEQVPQAVFVMKGQGPLETMIRQRLSDSRTLADKVFIEDAREPVPDLMAAADLLVVPSRMEGIAYVSYEAMAHGLPQVYADVGGQSELLDATTGVSIAVGSQEVTRYADAVVALLQQPEHRRRMGEAAKIRIHSWPSADDMAADYRALYAELLRDTSIIATNDD